MASIKIVKELQQIDMLEDEELFNVLPGMMSKLNGRNYNQFIAICKKFHITDSDFFMKVYVNSDEDVQYKLWKDRLVSSCPAKKLLKDIVSENEDVSKLVNSYLNEDILKCNAYFSGIQDVIVRQILNAKESLKIAMAWFTNPVIFDSLLKACRKGIEVTLLINNDLINNRPNGLPFNKLIQNGAQLYIAESPSLIHHKFCIIDEKVVIDGSYNWTVLAEKNNDENIVVIENGKVINDFVSAFDNLTDNCTEVDQMPNRVPEKQEYDCTSYKYVNSEEYALQLSETKSIHKQRAIYKEIFKLLPEQSAKEKIPSELFDSIKQEVTEEQNRDRKLFEKSIADLENAIHKEQERNERKTESQRIKISKTEVRKALEASQYRTRIGTIKAKQLPQAEKDSQIKELQKNHKAEMARINKTLANQNAELEILKAESNVIEERHKLAESLHGAELEGDNGLCRLNLKWNTADDLDLHLILPSGNLDGNMDVYYSHMKAEYKGGICYLDHDAIPGKDGENPQENIVWKNNLPDGEYKVVVKLFGKKSNRDIIPFSIFAFAGNYVKEQVFEFVNAKDNDIIEITTLSFKNGKVVTPILFKI